MLLSFFGGIMAVYRPNFAAVLTILVVGVLVILLVAGIAASSYS